MNLKPVLYAEDEENDVFFLKRAFREVGILHPLVIVPDGQQAIDYCAGQGSYADRDEHPLPCLMLLDLNMPGKSGMQVLQWVRHESCLPTLPIIILTSSLQDSDLELAYRQGANAYLVKPSQPAELLVMAKSIKDFWLSQNRPTVPNDNEGVVLQPICDALANKNAPFLSSQNAPVVLMKIAIFLRLSTDQFCPILK